MESVAEWILVGFALVYLIWALAFLLNRKK
jgi:hypothetical protein